MDNTTRTITPHLTGRSLKWLDVTANGKESSGSETDKVVQGAGLSGSKRPFLAAAPSEAKVEEPLTSKIVGAYNAFGMNVFSELLKQGQDKNVFISPSSIATALTMTYNGAEGTTRNAMASTLGISSMSAEDVNKANAELIHRLTGRDPKVCVEIANSLWASNQVELYPDFVKRNSTYLGAEVNTLDFSRPDTAASSINNWTSQMTHGKIKKLFDPSNFNKDTALVLVNAVYFKGKWSTPFDKKLTDENAQFHLADGSTKKIPLMSQSGNYRYFEDEQVQGINLPYGDGKMSMVVLLPKEETTLSEVQKGLNPDQWKNWISGFKYKEGTIQLPRFKMEYEAELNSPLQALGMGEAFGPKANFRGAIKPSAFAQDFHIDKVKHKAVLEVNEEGSEAAAATGVSVFRTTCVRLDTPFFMKADHPFLCAICDNETGAMLFLGSVQDPK